MLEPQEASNFPARQQHRQTDVLLTQPQFSAVPSFEVEECDGQIGRSRQGADPPLGPVHASEAHERRRAVQQQRLTGKYPPLPERPPPVMIPSCGPSRSVSGGAPFVTGGLDLVREWRRAFLRPRYR